MELCFDTHSFFIVLGWLYLPLDVFLSDVPENKVCIYSVVFSLSSLTSPSRIKQPSSHSLTRKHSYRLLTSFNT
jgi:hypothetical protein